jgi:hypothetical protein
MPRPQKHCIDDLHVAVGGPSSYERLSPVKTRSSSSNTRHSLDKSTAPTAPNLRPIKTIME